MIDALETAERYLLIRAAGGRYSFTHDKVAEALYSDLTPARQRMLHRRALQALEAEGHAPAADLLRHALGAEAWLQAVTYAKQAAPDNHDNENGAGLGIVDIFDANGVFVKTLVGTGGALNAPWGMALAPNDFGTLSGALLVGNFGDGKVNGYDANSGQFVGTVTLAGGAFAVPGLWGIAFGNDANSQPHNTLFFAAGTNDEANGLYGRIDLP